MTSAPTRAGSVWPTSSVKLVCRRSENRVVSCMTINLLLAGAGPSGRAVGSDERHDVIANQAGGSDGAFGLFPRRHRLIAIPRLGPDAVECLTRAHEAAVAAQ